MTLEEAISNLKKIVKYSAIPGQKHIDLSLVNSQDLPLYEASLKVANGAVFKGVLTRDQLLHRIGLD